MVSIIYSKDFYLHTPPRGGYHPENPSRLDIAIRALQSSGFSVVEAGDAKPGANALDILFRVHDESYVRYILKLCEQGFEGYIDGDTYVSRGSCKATLRAVELTLLAVEKVVGGEEDTVFVLTRPPGHHTGVSGRALGAPTQGFCLFNNIAAGAMYAKLKGLKPIAIVDIDVHHGNGTQEIFWRDPEVIHIDIHEWGIYPGTGWLTDIGGEGAEGTKINVALSPGAEDDDYIYTLLKIVEPVIRFAKPKLLMISAGFDAYKDDGLADMKLTQRFYKTFGETVKAIAKSLGTPIVAVLEGGYSTGLKKGLPAMIKGLTETQPSKIGEEQLKPSEKTKNTIEKLIQTLKQYITL